MSPRRILRIVLSAGLLILVWTRAARAWHSASAFWLAGCIVLSVLLLFVIVAELAGVQEKWRRQRDQVPKKPLSLDV